MLTLSKVLHLLALGLWFGMAIFFSFVVAFSLFGSFEKAALSAENDPDRVWFPRSQSFERQLPSMKLPKPLRKEQGTRAAGYAISPMFDWYFILQAACAGITALTAVGWVIGGFSGKAHRIRAVVLILALVTVGVGWLMERVVGELRIERNDITDHLLIIEKPTADDVKMTEEARANFGTWHGISLLVNLGTIVLVTVALALAAALPSRSDACCGGPPR